jgi:hypothetical protein
MLVEFRQGVWESAEHRCWGTFANLASHASAPVCVRRVDFRILGRVHCRCWIRGVQRQELFRRDDSMSVAVTERPPGWDVDSAKLAFGVNKTNRIPR